MELNNLTTTLSKIEVEDLELVELDLSFQQLASLGFLLYGDTRHSEFILQKLLIIANAPTTSEVSVPKDILRNYATHVNKGNWRETVIEGLAIINARRVLRKLGFKWEIIKQYFLPHVAELSLHIHPVLKALYTICERLAPAEAGKLISYMQTCHSITHQSSSQLHFYDISVLEIFLLDWMTRHVISIGDIKGHNADLQALLQYFKLNDLDQLKALLIDTLDHNMTTDASNDSLNIKTQIESEEPNQPDEGQKNTMNNNLECELSYMSTNNISFDRYNVSAEQAGFILIINQKDFYQDPDPNLKDLLPKKEFKQNTRKGTDIDKEKLKNTFSAFGYIPIVLDNLTHVELLGQIRETARRSLNYDSLIVCILSHGFNGAVYGCNSIPVYFDDIEDIFTEEALKNKPKILIVQACQTENNSNDPKTKKKTAVSTRYTDILKAMSTIPGFPAIRNKLLGSWFIQTLCETVSKYGNRKHLCDILTTVNRKVSEKSGLEENEVMLPMLVSTLRKNLYLPKMKDTT